MKKKHRVSKTELLPNDEALRIDSLIMWLEKLIYKRWEEKTAKHNLTPPQNKILRLLQKEDNVPFYKLKEHLSCTKSNLTGIVEGMVKKGLVKRKVDPKIRRIVRVRLTDKGKGILKKLPSWNRIYGNSPATQLPVKDAKKLLSLLEKMYKIANEK
ncbi:MAG: MarR family transcriptional regulator [bacterium]